MIDQNTLISQQLSLWDQKGSRVIRGNLIVIPIENSFLYVEPVYLTSEGTNIPQLKRVIVTSGNKVVMEPTLEGSLKAVFGTVPEAVGVQLPFSPSSKSCLKRERFCRRRKRRSGRENGKISGKPWVSSRESCGSDLPKINQI
jgi:uncharacterized membrane protein (UPF0182 family)